MISAVAVILGFASYAFVMLSLFRLFRVNYFNPIVKIFATYLEPVHAFEKKGYLKQIPINS